MAKKALTEGVKTLTAVSYDRYGKAVIAFEQSSGILTKQEVCCAGPEGWHPDKDDIVNTFTDGKTMFVEPAGWEPKVSLNKKIEMALERRDINIRRELLDNTFSEPEIDWEAANAEMAARKKKKSASAE